ncbi:HET-domain-containing protein [Lojkania enalia]|uniref:HET-domain-containing protein n=1 Tax=Lojkania enalia TaxID=147567 RepID=A0A9P4K541_9PLEO|nr:HET-domain-containing protein [Didymosphaeria enalia]
MRLLHFSSGKLVLTDFSGKRIPPYAILSHRWDGDNEVLFVDLNNNYWRKKRGCRKIEFCAKQAAQDQLQYFWIDTCCIDKWNVRERSKAINSMFNWYENAAKCYVFLDNSSTWEASFRQSKWFTRGWTLQELITPKSVKFFSYEERRIGNRSTLEQIASNRETTEEEDSIYYLLRILNISLTPSYGEGKENALRRLQLEIELGSNAPAIIPFA